MLLGSLNKFILSIIIFSKLTWVNNWNVFQINYFSKYLTKDGKLSDWHFQFVNQSKKPILLLNNMKNIETVTKIIFQGKIFTSNENEHLRVAGPHFMGSNPLATACMH